MLPLSSRPTNGRRGAPGPQRRSRLNELYETIEVFLAKYFESGEIETGAFIYAMPSRQRKSPDGGSRQRGLSYNMKVFAGQLRAGRFFGDHEHGH